MNQCSRFPNRPSYRKSSHTSDWVWSRHGQLVRVPTAEAVGFLRACNVDRALGIGQEAHRAVEVGVPARFTYEESADASIQTHGPIHGAVVARPAEAMSKPGVGRAGARDRSRIPIL